MKIITTSIDREDVRDVATRLKMFASDNLIDRVLREYDDYNAQYPDENWSAIVEIMLYDYKHWENQTAEPDRFFTDGDGGNDVNL
jgi:hypothetical protein